MKKLKIKKCMTSFLMLAVMVVSIIGIMPKTIAFASTFSYVQVESWRGDDGDKFTSSWSPVGGSGIKYYVAYSNTHTNIKFFAISKGESFKISSTNMTNDVITGTSKIDYTGSVSVDGDAYYYFVYDIVYPAPSDNTNFYDFQYSGASGTCLFSEAHTNEEFVKYFISGKFPDDCDFNTTMTSTTDGSADNPIEDEDIGHLILTGQKGQDVLPDNRDTDAISSYQVFTWKSKTDTGFSLTKNKYAQTRIEAKVESRCVIYKHMNSYYVKNNFTNKKIEENNEVKEKFKNFGESATISKIIPADTLEYVLSFDKIDELLPKTAKEWHNDLYVGHNYRVYFRVLCTDSLTVIPDENDNSWHSGGWSYVDFSLDGVVSGNGDGHFDENGEWVTDDKKDDINNGGRDTFVDDDAAKDDRNNSADWGRDDSDSDSGLDASSIKGFMNQVGNVPKAIGKLFTFLPDWVTTFIAFGFVLLVALMIIKAIRG